MNGFISKGILFLGLMFVFISSPLRYTEGFGYLADPLLKFGGLIVLIVAIAALSESKFEIGRDFKHMIYLYAGFICLVIMSVIVNADIESGFYSIERFVLHFLILVVFLVISRIASEALVINAFLIISVGMILYFVIAYPIPDMPFSAYKGGFGNPNSLGVFSVTMFSVSIVAALGIVKVKGNYLLAIVYFLIALSAIYFTVISASRTSFLTLVAIMLIVLCVFVVSILKSRELLSIKSILMVTILVSGIIALFILIDNPLTTAIETNIIEKFERQISRGRITAGRADIWSVIIQDAGMFGKGVNHFKEISGFSAHNSFLHIVSLYGWLAGIFYLVFWILALVKSVKYYFNERLTNAYALLPFIIIVNFLMISIMENMTNHVSVFLALTMVAIVCTGKNRTFLF